MMINAYVGCRFVPRCAGNGCRPERTLQKRIRKTKSIGNVLQFATKTMRKRKQCGHVYTQWLQAKFQNSGKQGRDDDGDDGPEEAKGQNVVQVVGFNLAKQV